MSKSTPNRGGVTAKPLPKILGKPAPDPVATGNAKTAFRSGTNPETGVNRRTPASVIQSDNNS